MNENSTMILLQHMKTIPILCFAVLILTAQAATADCLIRFGWSRSEPYAYRIYDNRLVGLDADMAKMVAEEADCRAAFFEYPSDRLMDALAEGRIDAAMVGDGTVPDADRNWTSASYRTERVRLFARAGQRISGSGVLDLLRNGFTVAVPQGLPLEKTRAVVSNDPVLGPRLREAIDEVAAYSLLMESRVEVAALREAKVPQLEDAAAFSGAVQPLDATVAEQPVRFALSRKTVDEGLKARIDDSIRSLRDQADFTSVTGIYIAAGRSKPPAE